MPKFLLSFILILASAAYAVSARIWQEAAKGGAQDSASAERAIAGLAGPSAIPVDRPQNEQSALAELRASLVQAAPSAPATASPPPPNNEQASVQGNVDVRPAIAPPPSPTPAQRDAAPRAADLDAHPEQYYLAQPGANNRPSPPRGRDFAEREERGRPPAPQARPAPPVIAEAQPRIADAAPRQAQPNLAPTPAPAPRPPVVAQAEPRNTAPPAPAPAAPKPAGLYKDGSFTGPVTDAYFGPLQVRAVVRSGKLVAVDILDYPADRRRSQQINSYAIPALQSEAIRVQSASVNMISGATLTVIAYRNSLAAALNQAKN